MLSANGPGAEVGGDASQPSIERFAALIPNEVTTRSGVVFYSGRDAFSSPSPLYLLGLNPGGDADVIGGTIKHHLEVALRDEPDNWSRYRDEPWGPGAKPGTWGLQPRVLHLLGQLSLDPGEVPSSNLVFPRSRQAVHIEDELNALADACWPVHEAVIEELEVRVVVCFGARVADYVRVKLGAFGEPWGTFVEQNRRGWTSRAYAGTGGVNVVQVTHPGRADWRNPAADITPLVQEAIARPR